MLGLLTRPLSIFLEVDARDAQGSEEVRTEVTQYCPPLQQQQPHEIQHPDHCSHVPAEWRVQSTSAPRLSARPVSYSYTPELAGSSPHISEGGISYIILDSNVSYHHRQPSIAQQEKL